MTSQQQPDQAGKNVEQFESRSISEIAAEWMLRWHANDLTPSQRQENLQWLQESPLHVAETLRMLRLHGWLRKHRSVFDFEGFQAERDRLV